MTRSSAPRARSPGIAALPDDVRHLYRTAWELPQRALIAMAAARQPYVDQSQSLNLFMASPTIGKLSSMYLHAWKSGLKTTYYLRSRPATRIQQATVTQVGRGRPRDPAPGHRPRPTRRRSRAPSRTPRAARPASEHHDHHDHDDHTPRPRRDRADALLLDPGLSLTLRPMRYPHFYDRYRDAIKNTWTVEEVDLHSDLADLQQLSAAERHLVGRLVAFFATGDTIVANNLVLNLYTHVNAPEARLYLSRQLFEEAVHVQFYLTLLDTYVPDEAERHEAFAAVENIPSIKAKADFCFRWIDSLSEVRTPARPRPTGRAFLLNLVCFAACIEGLFFYGAFAYVYFLRSRGLLNGLASGTNWVFRDESMHMAFAFDVIDTAREEEPDLVDEEFADDGAADDGRGRRRGGAVRRRTCSAGEWRGSPAPTCAPTSSTSPTGGSSGSGSRPSTGRATRWRSWSCRTCRSSRTSSSGGCRPTRWGSPAR